MAKAKPTCIEEWWAIRIGEEPKYDPYFCIDDTSKLQPTPPALFQHKHDAENYKRTRNIVGSVVRVMLSDT